MKSAPLLCAAGLLLAAGCVAAQPVYRQVDPKGKVTYSDQPPAAAAAQVVPAGRGDGASAAGNVAGSAALPYELRQTVGRYPVTLYTGDDCAPCTAGRALLTARGVPFTERTVRTPEDAQALQSLTGQGSLPVLGVGAQQVKGFSEAEWAQYLDAAGYPPAGRLPPGWRNPPAAPLVALRPAPAAAPAAPAATPAAQPRRAPPEAPSPANPAGIRF